MERFFIVNGVRVVDGGKQPRYVLVAVADVNLKVFGKTPADE